MPKKRVITKEEDVMIRRLAKYSNRAEISKRMQISIAVISKHIKRQSISVYKRPNKGISPYRITAHCYARNKSYRRIIEGITEIKQCKAVFRYIQQMKSVFYQRELIDLLLDKRQEILDKEWNAFLNQNTLTIQ